MTIDHLAVLRAESALVAQLARTVPHDAPVPALAGCTVHDVLAHLVGDVDWVLATIAERRVAPGGIVASAARGTDLCDEWDDRTHRLLAALTDVDPAEPCPNFAQGAAGRIGFHVRHQAFETTIHRWDIESASGAHAPIDAAVAADAIDELLETYTVRYSPHALAAPVTIGCDDVAAAWRIAPDARAGFVTAERVDAAAPDVSAAAVDLLLLLWQRLAPDDGRITYRVDPAGVRPFLEGPLTA